MKTLMKNVMGALLAIGLFGVAVNGYAALIVVDNPTEVQAAGTCDLGSAIVAAETNATVPPSSCAAGAPGADVIDILPLLPGSNITYSSPCSLTTCAPATALPIIREALTINGDPSGSGSNTTLTAVAPGFRFLFIATASGSPTQVPVVINDLTLTGADESFGGGGAILSIAADLTLNGSSVVYNTTSNLSGGGGIKLTAGNIAPGLTPSILRLNNSHVDFNVAPVGGGIIASNSEFHIENGSSVSDNSLSIAGGAGGGIHSQCLALADCTIINHTIIDSSIDRNITIPGVNSKGAGGLLLSNTFDIGSINIAGSSISNNVGHTSGGGASISHVDKVTISGTATNPKSRFNDNQVLDNGLGGANGGGANIFSVNEVSISDTEFNRNHADLSAGGLSLLDIQHPATITTIQDSEFLSNTAGLSEGGVRIGDILGDLVINNVRVEDNIADDPGANLGSAGGMLISNVNGDTSIINSKILRNKTLTGNGGGLLVNNADVDISNNTEIAYNTAAIFGGGIEYRGNSTSSIDNSKIYANEAGFDGGGICAFTNPGSSLTITNGSLIGDSTNPLLGNKALFGEGGGIWSGRSLIVENSEVSFNTAGGIGGGIVVRRSDLTMNLTTVANNKASISGGGLYFSDSPSSSIRNSILKDNQADSDGGALKVTNFSFVSVISSTVEGNSSRFASAANIEFSTLDITGSTVSRNIVLPGGNGGLLYFNAFGTLTNSTVSQNTGDIAVGILGFGSDIILRNSTVTNNVATIPLVDGAGIINGNDASNFVIFSSIIALNNTPNSSPAGVSQDCIDFGSQPFISLGHNIDSDGTCNLNQPTDLPNQNFSQIRLDTLANNGGPIVIETNRLKDAVTDGGVDSVAIDAGNCLYPGGSLPLPAGAQNPILTDERGVVRDALCDIGAYEVLPPDTDGDGILNDVDYCPEGTNSPEAVAKLGVNHWILGEKDVDVADDGSIAFVTNLPKGQDPDPNGNGVADRGFSLLETAGCSCAQIIELVNNDEDLENDLGKGHSKFGCSISAMETWVDFIANQ